MDVQALGSSASLQTLQEGELRGGDRRLDTPPGGLCRRLGDQGGCCYGSQTPTQTSCLAFRPFSVMSVSFSISTYLSTLLKSCKELSCESD